MVKIIQLIALGMAVFALLIAYLRLREKKLTVRGFLLWSFLWVSVVVVAFLPGVTSYLSDFVGIERGIDVLVYLSIVVMLYLIFRLNIKFEDTERRLTKIVRELALQKKK